MVLLRCWGSSDERKTRRAAALLQEVPRQIEVGGVAGGAVQAEQRDLDLLVAGRALRAVAGEVAHQQIGRTPCDRQQFCPSGGLVVRDARLDQVTVAIQLVFDLEIGPARAGEVDLVIGEEVAIGHLCAAQERDEARP